MLRKHKWNLILSSIALLLPVLAGLLLWDRLPAQMVTHWGADGVPDGMGSRAFTVFGMPLILLAVHFLCIAFTVKDPASKKISRQALGIVFWICPLISISISTMSYRIALGRTDDLMLPMLLMMGAMFLILGNYLPKCGRNRRFGIKIKWTLASDENWDATHRLGGRLWVIGGLAIMLCALLPSAILMWVLPAIFLAMILVPVIYSYVFHRRQVQAGTAPKDVKIPRSKTEKNIICGVSVFLVLLFAFLAFIMFTGDIALSYGEESFTIEADWSGDLTVRYDEYDTIEYRETHDPGSRTYGFASARLSMGTFRSEEFGSYTRYCYTQCDACVVLTSGEHTLILNGKDAAATRAIYDTLLAK